MQRNSTHFVTESFVRKKMTSPKEYKKLVRDIITQSYVKYNPAPPKKKTESER